jgi:hypothetical protein
MKAVNSQYGYASAQRSWAELKQDRGKDYEKESNHNRLCAGGAGGVRANKHNYN